MSGVAILLHQFRFDQKVFWRNPAAVFFTALLPLLFLFLLATIFKNTHISDVNVKGATYYIPAILTLAVVSATTVKLATNLPAEREAGQLKRVRGTPLPPAAFVAGRVGNSLVISVIMVVLVSVIGAVLYGVTIPTHTMPAMLVTLAVGAFSFSCLGFALAAAIPTAQAAPAVTNATVLPLYFLSGVFIPQDELPNGILNFADRCSPFAPSSRRCSRPGIHTRRGRGSNGATSRWSRRGACSASSSRFASSAGNRGADAGRPLPCNVNRQGPSRLSAALRCSITQP